ncbi:MAG: hypothetical protein LBB34_04840 [Holosporales bacterium]|jgi:hypothetical protein|nr:hypothetical protein [Holosporales bacterium]
MRTFSKAITLISLFSSHCVGEKSFFFTDEETDQILKILKKSKNDNSETKALNVSGIFYIDNLNWTIWIDGIPYSSIGQKKDFSIDEVSEDAVVLTMPDGKTIEISVNTVGE